MSRTSVTLDTLVRALQTNCGDMYDACRKANVSPVFVKAWAKDDKEVAEAIAEAERVGAMQIESAAIQRAIIGVEDDVYFKGMVVGQKRVYSDGLHLALLKARLPERYGKESEGGGGIVVHGQAQINLMPRAETYDDWLRMRDSTLALRETKALPMSTDIIEATATPVSPLAGLGL